MPLVAAATVVALSACTGSTIRSQEPLVHEARQIIVDPIEADKPEWQRLARRIRRELIAELERTGSFDSVTKAPAPLSHGDLVHVGGRVEAIDPGIDGVSLLTGPFGWGGASLSAHFVVRDRNGRRLAEFTETVGAAEPLAEATVIGSIFDPHFQPLYADELADALAAEAADVIAEWAAEARQSQRRDDGGNDG